MKKNAIIIAISLIIMCGCNKKGTEDQPIPQVLSEQIVETNFPDNRTPDSYQPWYQDWVNQEFPQNSKPTTPQDGVVDLEMAILATQDVIYSITWKSKSDEDYYWQTSEETMTKGSGTCIDEAILIYINLRNQGFSDSNLVITYLRQGDKAHSTIAIIKDGIIKCLDGKDRSDWTLTQTWNLFGVWRHDGK